MRTVNEVFEAAGLKPVRYEETFGDYAKTVLRLVFGVMLAVGYVALLFFATALAGLATVLVVVWMVVVFVRD